MVKLISQPDADAMDRTFAALADPTRRAILARMAAESDGQGVRVTELAAPFIGAPSEKVPGEIPGAGEVPGAGKMSLPAVSKHLRVLERAGLLKQEKDGRVRRCFLVAGPLKNAHDWVAFYRRFWTDRLDALADYLESESNPAPEES